MNKTSNEDVQDRCFWTITKNVALESADWSVLRDRAGHRRISRTHLADPDGVIERFAAF